MAACGGLEQIFEKPFSETPTFLEALSPWKHIKSNDPSSFAEIFHEVTPPEASTADQERGEGSSNSATGYDPCSERKQYRNNDSFSLCTEGLGFESFEDVEHDLSDKEWRNEEGVEERDQDGGDDERSLASSYLESHRSEEVEEMTGRGALPPPISSIGRCGKPWVYFKSYREDGRFILKEIRIPTQEFLHACRQDGRLKLQFVQSDDDEEGVEENGKDGSQTEGEIEEHYVESRDSKLSM